MPGTQIRSAEDGTKTLYGHFARFGEWTEINSAWEGRFMERIAPGAFSKTISENRGGMRVLFDHGHDPSIGNKPLGAIRSLEEDTEGARYEVDLFDSNYVRDLLPALEAGQLGASFRFKVMREDFNKKPERGDHNPDGLPERTITEAKVMEFGPVTFPAYAGATAGVRSLTDDYILRHLFAEPERLRAVLAAHTEFPAVSNIVLDGEMVSASILEELHRHRMSNAPSTPTPADATSEPERRDDRVNRFKNREEYLSWLSTS
jgi:HK97 family phage prohead protease